MSIARAKREARVRTLFRWGCALVLAAAMGYFFVPGLKAPGVRVRGRARAASYDMATEASVSGTLARPPARGRMGLYLSVQQPGGEMVDVRLAPRRYLADCGVSLRQGDELEVTGSRMTVGGSPLLIAREITKQGRTLEVRDRAGKPLWR